MRARRIVVVLAASMTFACAGEPTTAMQGTAEDETAVRSLAERYASAFNANDPAGIAALVSEDYRVVEPDGTLVTGRAGVEKMATQDVEMRQKMGANLTLGTSTDFVQWLDAETATLGGTWTMDGLPPEQPNRGSWLAVAEKTADGEWQIASVLAANYMPPPATPPPAAK